MEIEIESQKKCQSERKLKMKVLGTQTRISEVNLTNRLQEMKQRISVNEDKMEKWIT